MYRKSYFPPLPQTRIINRNIILLCRTSVKNPQHRYDCNYIIHVYYHTHIKFLTRTIYLTTTISLETSSCLRSSCVCVSWKHIKKKKKIELKFSWSHMLNHMSRWISRFRERLSFRTDTYITYSLYYIYTQHSIFNVCVCVYIMYIQE